MPEKRPAARTTLFDSRVCHFHMQSVEDDRGVLLPFSFESLDFSPVHYFVVTGRNGVTRGGHAHRSGSQVLVRIAGNIEIQLAFQGAAQSLTLDAPMNALYIASPVWSSQTYHGENACLMVFSDRAYDPASYIDQPQ
tara:strand:- start:17534 stop:17944 length:411 start_codon:yes stop_codon:yes gene_type:complete